jgi:plastocyanin
MRHLAPLVAVCMLAAAIVAPAAVAQQPATRAVTIRDFSFGPATVNVKAGDTVTWENDGKTDHTATGKGFDTGVLSPGDSGSFTFNDAGTFAYVCSIHPKMKGTVKVAAADTGKGGKSGGGKSKGGAGGSKGSPPSAPGGAGLPRTGEDELRLAGLGALLLALGATARLVLGRRGDAR